MSKKRFFLTSLFVIFSLSCFAQFNKVYTTPNPNSGVRSLIEVDSCVYIITTAADSSFDYRSTSILVKIDHYGNEMWRKSFGADTTSLYHWLTGSMILSSDSNLVLIAAKSDTLNSLSSLIYKVDFDGEILWQTEVNLEVWDYPRSIIELNGAFYFCGVTSDAPTNIWTYDTFIGKLSQNGDLIFVNRLAEPTEQFVHNIATGLDGASILVAESDELYSLGDLVISSIDTFGNYQWRNYMRTPAQHCAGFISTDPVNSKVLVAACYDTILPKESVFEPVVLLADEFGNIEGQKFPDWSKSTLTLIDEIYYVQPYIDNSYLVVGRSFDKDLGATQGRIMHIDSTGKTLGQPTFNYPGSESSFNVFYTIDFASNGDMYLGGKAAALSGSQMWVVKIAAADIDSVLHTSPEDTSVVDTVSFVTSIDIDCDLAITSTYFRDVISVSLTLSCTDQLKEVALYALNGQQIRSAIKSADNFQLRIYDLPNGTYLLRGITESGRVVSTILPILRQD